MDKHFYNERCPKCKNKTLTINHSEFHHIEFCSKDDCDYKYEEFKEGYEDFLYNKFRE